MATKGEDIRLATEEEMAEDAIATATEQVEFTQAVVTVGGASYVLEFDRASVKRMEAEGLDVSEVDTKPVTVAERLIDGAFDMHHPRMTHEERMAVWEAMPNKVGEDGLLGVLVRLYMAPVNSLMADPTTPTGTWKLA